MKQKTQIENLKSSPKCAISFPDPIQVRNGVSNSLLGFHLSILPAYSYDFETKHKSNLGPKFVIELNEMKCNELLSLSKYSQS